MHCISTARQYILVNLFSYNILFQVSVNNRKYGSKTSAVAMIVFDGDANLHNVSNLKVENSTNSSISLSWKYTKPVDGFNVQLLSGMYPRFPTRRTTTTNITIDNLPPGAQFTIIVHAFKNGMVGSDCVIHAQTTGNSLPQIVINNGTLDNLTGTTVYLAWNKAVEESGSTRNVEWVYGLYYGIDDESLSESEYFVFVFNRIRSMVYFF